MSRTLVLKLACLGERSNGPAGCTRSCGAVYRHDDGHFEAVLKYPHGRRAGEEIGLSVNLDAPARQTLLDIEPRHLASCGRHQPVETDLTQLLIAARAAYVSRRLRTVPLPRARAR